MSCAGANVDWHNRANTRTPHLDEERAHGIPLDRHYSFRWCAPARSALMTGRMPYHVLETTNYVTGKMNMIPCPSPPPPPPPHTPWADFCLCLES